MKIICDIASLTNKNTIDAEALTVLNKLTAEDSLTIITDSNEMTIKTELLSMLLSLSANVKIKKCDDAYALCLALGMELANDSDVNVALKNQAFAGAKNLLSQNPNITLGWTKKPAKKKKKVTTPVIKTEETAPSPVVEAKPEKEVKKTKIHEPDKTLDELIANPPKKGKKSDKISTIKSIVGSGYSAQDYKTMERIILEATDDSEMGLVFLCKINLPILYGEEGFLDKLKKAYASIRK